MVHECVITSVWGEHLQNFALQLNVLWLFPYSWYFFQKHIVKFLWFYQFASRLAELLSLSHFYWVLLLAEDHRKWPNYIKRKCWVSNSLLYGWLIYIYIFNVDCCSFSFPCAHSFSHRGYGETLRVNNLNLNSSSLHEYRQSCYLKTVL